MGLAFGIGSKSAMLNAFSIRKCPKMCYAQWVKHRKYFNRNRYKCFEQNQLNGCFF